MADAELVQAVSAVVPREEDDPIVRLQVMQANLEAQQQRLVCYDFAKSGDVIAAAAACEAVEGWRGEVDAHQRRLGCKWALDTEFCARELQDRSYLEAVRRLRVAGVPEDSAELVSAALPGAPEPMQLQDTEALRLVQAFLHRDTKVVVLGDGDRVLFYGSEWCLVLSGETGCGKSLAGAWAIAQAGGLWLKARALERVRFDLDEAIAAPLLVLDEVGGERLTRSRLAVDRVAELLEERHQARRRTILTTNLRRRRHHADDDPQFVERYGARVDSRLRDRAVYAVLTDQDLRGLAA